MSNKEIRLRGLYLIIRIILDKFWRLVKAGTVPSTALDNSTGIGTIAFFLTLMLFSSLFILPLLFTFGSIKPEAFQKDLSSGIIILESQRHLQHLHAILTIWGLLYSETPI